MTVYSKERQFVALERKIKYIKLCTLKVGKMSYAQAARETGVHSTTVKRWVDDKEKLFEQVKQAQPKTYSYMRKPRYPLMEKALALWLETEGATEEFPYRLQVAVHQS